MQMNPKKGEFATILRQYRGVETQSKWKERVILLLLLRTAGNMYVYTAPLVRRRNGIYMYTAVEEAHFAEAKHTSFSPIGHGEKGNDDNRGIYGFSTTHN